jgi:PTS system mannose-specific IID component
MGVRVNVLARLLTIQAAWNYETMLGTGVGFSVEPALRRLPGGIHGAAYRAALARESRYFNAHPYLASVAVGALARAELDGCSPDRIERFRVAMCGPLGSVGDRLVWAGWLPFCSLLGLIAFGVGMSPAIIVLLFLGVYNAGHIALRVWGLHIGWASGLNVAAALATPVLHRGPELISRAAALCAGIALPLVLRQLLGTGGPLMFAVIPAIALATLVLVRMRRRYAEGLTAAMAALAAFVLLSMVLRW